MSAGAAGFLLLLILGTQILDWQWPVGVFLATLGLGLYRAHKARVPVYRTAQALDKALDLQDRLSTAYYFRRLAPKSTALVDEVEAQAIGRVRDGDVERAMPLRFPRAGYVAVGLAVVAVTLVAVRYGVLRTMSLQQPLARINFDTFSSPDKVEAASASKKSVVQEHLDKQLEQLGLTPEEMDLPMESSAEKPNATNVSAISNEPGGEQKGPPGKNESDPSDDSEEGQDNEPGQPSGENKDPGSTPLNAGQKSGQAPKNPPKAPQKPGGQNPGVVDKMKDAFANLLNKLGVTPPGEKGQEMASQQSQQQGTGKEQAADKGTQGQGKSQGDSQPSPDSQGKESEGGEQTPGQQQRASDQQGAKGPNENSKSGMGKSDGDKTIQDAEQLRAMGKISEIFGKRAAEMKGEMSIEAPSGKQ
ncbi:MAG TPA: hypothetical protein VER03_14210, partial [Bryobacteraceae bacterium]|nr:hypothetical protein [Bryobacteraceae bacterium]